MRRSTVIRVHLSALRISVVVALIGWIVMTVGMVGNAPQLITIGSRMFVSFVSVWGFANGAVLAWGIYEAGRAEGWRHFLHECRDHPWSRGVYALLTVFLLGVGWAMTALLVRESIR